MTWVYVYEYQYFFLAKNKIPDTYLFKIKL